MLTVDLDAIATNYRAIQGLLNGAVCAAVVKADAYGLGMRPVARTLVAAGCRHFFISSLDEGIALRAALDDVATAAAIYVFNGLIEGAEATYDRADLVPVLNAPWQVDAWAAHARRRGGRRAVVKLDTGMGRLGLTVAELDTLSNNPTRLDGLEIEYVMSHLACADEPDHPLNAGQLASFNAGRNRLPTAKASLANSAGVFLGPAYHFDLVRPGAALYGISCIVGRPNPMTRAVGLQGRILRFRDVDSEITVGYGATRRIRRGRRLATVASGYADGFPRALSNRGRAFVGDVEVPVVGRVSMDLVTFDVTDVPAQELRPGDYVELIGPHHSVEDLAKASGTIGYEILTRLGCCSHRTYVGGEV